MLLDLKKNKRMSRILIIGASGRIGSKVVRAIEKENSGDEIVLATSKTPTADKWKKEGKNAVVLDLNQVETFESALNGIDRLFLLTGYTADMLYQSKQLVDAAKSAGVKHIVHLGVYSNHHDPIPHFAWHDMIESYIKASGLAWTNIHPNVVTESVFDQRPTVFETGHFLSFCGDAPQGWVCTDDIADVAASVLLQGPEIHSGKDYFLSLDVLTADEFANILSEAIQHKVTWTDVSVDAQRHNFSMITDPGTRLYMDSALITMSLTRELKFPAQTAIHDDVMTVTGHKGTSMRQWVVNMIRDRN